MINFSDALTDYCYIQMFYNCESLTEAPELPATALADFCYFRMFAYCERLTEAPELPATTLTHRCYAEMFSNCESLTEAPELPATTLVDYCYEYMFFSCSSLNSVTVKFTEWVGSHTTLQWLNAVSNDGTFRAPEALEDLRGDSYIPEDWTRVAI